MRIVRGHALGPGCDAIQGELRSCWRCNTRQRAFFLVALRLGIVASILNFAWEMLQTRYFVGMAELGWWTATWICLKATVGDVAMILLALWLVGVATDDKLWIDHDARAPVAAFMALSVLQALALEWYSVRSGRWSYGPDMPIDPILHLGLAPVLQWFVIPAASAWITKRLRRSSRTGARRQSP